MDGDQPLGLLIEVARQELVYILESLPGPKHLLVEPRLLRPLDRIASMSLLQRHGCLKVFTLAAEGVLPSSVLPSPDAAPGTAETRARRVFFLRSSLSAARRLALFARSDPATTTSVMWVDRRQAVASRELEKAGVFGLVDEYQLALPMLPLESDLFSLELPQSRHLDVYSVCHALYQLQSLYGLFPTVYGVGAASTSVWKMMKVLYGERGEPRARAEQPISHLFLLDRTLDPASVLLTGLTYEAMLHDAFSIKCGKVSFGPEVEERLRPKAAEAETGDSPQPAKSTIVTLDNNDGIFASVRNMHIAAVFPWLSAKAREIKASYSKGAALDGVSEMKQFVSQELRNLKTNHRQLETHICACEVLLERSGSGSASERLALEHSIIAADSEMNKVLSFLEDAILSEQSPWSVLSLACLASVASCGLPPKVLSSFRESFIHAYGYEYIPVLHSLSSRRLLQAKPPAAAAAGALLAKIGNDGKAAQQLPRPSLTSIPSEPSLALAGRGGSPSNIQPTMPFLIKRLGLVPGSEESPVNVKSPDRLSYVFSGAFSPPLATLIADTMVRGWKNSEAQKTFGQAFAEANTLTPVEKRPDSRMRKAILAVFLGGVTYAEVAALRWLAAQNNFRILIATTHIIHREEWLKCMGEVEES